MSTLPGKKFDRDQMALWFFLGSLILGMLLLVVLLVRSYFF